MRGDLGQYVYHQGFSIYVCGFSWRSLGLIVAIMSQRPPPTLCVSVIMFMTYVRASLAADNTSTPAPPGADLYPYGPSIDSASLRTGHRAVSVDLSRPFRFLGRQYDHLNVNRNGIISFVGSYLGVIPGSLPFESDPLISPMWIDLTTADDRINITVDVSYRGSTATNLLDDVTQDVRRAISTWDEQDGIESTDDFVVISVFIVTWVSRVDIPTNSSLTLPDRVQMNNTFQCVLINSMDSSYVMLNYGTISWLNQEVNEFTRTNPDDQTEPFPQAGFNQGDSRTYLTLPSSGSHSMFDLVRRSNIEDPGRWLFRVDEETWFDNHCVYCHQNCAQLSAPKGGRLDILNVAPGPGRKIQYNCHQGSLMVGNDGYNQRTCMIDGQWTGSDVSCTWRNEGAEALKIAFVSSVVCIVAVAVTIIIIWRTRVYIYCKPDQLKQPTANEDHVIPGSQDGWRHPGWMSLMPRSREAPPQLYFRAANGRSHLAAYNPRSMNINAPHYNNMVYNNGYMSGFLAPGAVGNPGAVGIPRRVDAGGSRGNQGTTLANARHHESEMKHTGRRTDVQKEINTHEATEYYAQVKKVHHNNVISDVDVHEERTEYPPQGQQQQSSTNQQEADIWEYDIEIPDHGPPPPHTQQYYDITIELKRDEKLHHFTFSLNNIHLHLTPFISMVQINSELDVM